MKALAALAFALIVVACGRDAEEAARPVLQVERLTFSPARAHGESLGYGLLRNSGAAGDTLLAASSPLAARIDIRGTRYEEDGARVAFTAAGGVPVPPHGETPLAPGGVHLRAIGLTADLVEGARAPITLVFEHGGEVQLEAVIAAPPG